MALIAALISAKDITYPTLPKAHARSGAEQINCKNAHPDIGAVCSVDTLHATQKAGGPPQKKCWCRANKHQQHNRPSRRRRRERPGHANSESKRVYANISVQNIFHQSGRSLKGLNQNSVPPRRCRRERSLQAARAKLLRVPTASP